eukprot:snap_masked-scaffold_8-processed-gene-9.31-mRNA-1 protein AED:1.00 eAED:1.00 QI:0/0/0/0/1/1/3/0/376
MNCFECKKKRICWKNGVNLGDDEDDIFNLYNELCEIEYKGKARVVHSWVGNGIGSALHFFAISATYALAIGRKIVPLSAKSSLSDLTEYFSGNESLFPCPIVEEFGCFFDEFPMYTLDPLEQVNSLDMFFVATKWDENWANNEDFLFNYESYSLSQQQQAARNGGIWNLQWFIPEKYVHNGALWFRSHLLHYYLQPSVNFLKRIEAVVDSIGLDLNKQCLAMHIRRGDKLSDINMKDSEFPGLNEYIQAANEIKRLHAPDLKQVFVSTEDQRALDELKSLAQNNFKVFYTQNKRQNLSNFFGRPEEVISIKDRIKRGLDDGYEQLDIAFLNLFIARDCNYFIGTLSSNWGRLVLELMTARNGKKPIYRSLDHDWIA